MVDGCEEAYIPGVDLPDNRGGGGGRVETVDVDDTVAIERTSAQRHRAGRSTDGLKLRTGNIVAGR